MDKLSETHAQLKKSFPWFDDDAWAWHYEPPLNGVPFTEPSDSQGDSPGRIAVYMPGASSEQYEAVKGWLAAHFNDARLIPGPEFVGEFASVATGCVK